MFSKLSHYKHSYVLHMHICIVGRAVDGHRSDPSGIQKCKNCTKYIMPLIIDAIVTINKITLNRQDFDNLEKSDGWLNCKVTA